MVNVCAVKLFCSSILIFQTGSLWIKFVLSSDLLSFISWLKDLSEAFIVMNLEWSKIKNQRSKTKDRRPKAGSIGPEGMEGRRRSGVSLASRLAAQRLGFSEPAVTETDQRSKIRDQYNFPVHTDHISEREDEVCRISETMNHDVLADAIFWHSSHWIYPFCSYLISPHSLSEGKGALVAVRAPTVLLPARRAVGIAAPRRGAHPFAVLEEIEDQIPVWQVCSIKSGDQWLGWERREAVLTPKIIVQDACNSSRRGRQQRSKIGGNERSKINRSPCRGGRMRRRRREGRAGGRWLKKRALSMLHDN